MQVEDLKRQLRDKEVELENLRQTDIRTLWLKDLDALLEAIEKQVMRGGQLYAPAQQHRSLDRCPACSKPGQPECLRARPCLCDLRVC